MRKSICALVALFIASLATGCGAVPDLRFGDDGDAGTSVLPDATVPTTTAEASTPFGGGDDSSSAPPGDDSSSTPIPPSGDAADDAPLPPPIQDSSVPPEASTAVCPNHPPFGASCCGTIECRPNGFTPCDCTTCDSQCTSTQVCCIDSTSKFQKCVATLADCPKP
jgi:hypothetical protein